MVQADLYRIRPGERALHGEQDAGGAIVQRNKSEPAVIEPEQPDIVRGLARQTLRSGKMSKNRGAVVLHVAALDAELIGKEGIAAGGVDHKLGVRKGLVHSVRKIDGSGLIVPRRHNLISVIGHADTSDFLIHVSSVEHFSDLHPKDYYGMK